MEKDVLDMLDNKEQFENFCKDMVIEFKKLSKLLSKTESLLFQRYSNLGALVLLELMAKRSMYSLEKNYEQNSFPDEYIQIIEKVADLIFKNLGFIMKAESKLKPS